MSDISLMLHGSLQWGYRQVEEWHFLAEIYKASLEAVDRVEGARVTVQFGGQDVEWLRHTHPELIELVGRMADNGQLEIAMGGYSHNFQGATPIVNVANLELGQAVCQETFEVPARGYWPAESMLNRGMPSALRDAGFAYCWFDNLNVRDSALHEYGLIGHSYRLRGAFDSCIDGLPFMHFEEYRRGAGAGVIAYGLQPEQGDLSAIRRRARQAPLLVEVSDWEHFNMSEQKVRNVAMGTFDTGGNINRVDDDKIAAWEEVLQALITDGHRFVTGTEALSAHPPVETLELIDGRDYTKNDLTRLVDACAWYGEGQGGLADVRKPHRMGDQESYSYSMAGAKAYGHLVDLQAAPADLDAAKRDILVSFCSAHRSGGSEFTVKQQVLDRVERVIEKYQKARAALPADSIHIPVSLPSGQWPVTINAEGLESDTFTLSSEDNPSNVRAYVERSENVRLSLARSHRLWISGPIEQGTYELVPATDSRSNAPNISRDRNGLELVRGSRRIRFDVWNGGNISLWEVDGFCPYRSCGGMQINAEWQEAPMVDQVPVEIKYDQVAGGILVECRFELGCVPVVKSYRVDETLTCCQVDVRCEHRAFGFLSPFAYQLDSSRYGGDSKFIMVAEGAKQISSEPLAEDLHMHHLGSELVAFACQDGIASIAVNRLSSSPILRRRPLSGEFVLMDARPINAADHAYPYQFSVEPVFEATLRVSTGGGQDRVNQWQQFYNHPPISSVGRPVLQQSDLIWTAAHPHISEVNPYF